MLVLSRRPGESIIINDNIELKIVEVKGEYVKLGITAPRSIPVHRKEVFEAIQRENARAAQTKKENVGELDRNLTATEPSTGSGEKHESPDEKDAKDNKERKEKKDRK